MKAEQIWSPRPADPVALALARARPGEPAIAGLLWYALASLPGCLPLLPLAPELQRAVGAALRDLGFAPREEYQLFVKSVAARVREEGLVPARV